jgi:F-type H+-transporting ATPase subunit b
MNINATLFAEMIVFISFVGLTRHYVLPPIIETIDQRQAELAKGYEDAKKAALALKTAKNEQQEILKKAKSEYNKLIASAKNTAQEMIEDAKKTAKVIEKQHIDSAQESIASQIAKQQESLQKKTLSFVEKVLHKVIIELPDQPQLETMVEHAIGEIDDNQ